MANSTSSTTPRKRPANAPTQQPLPLRIWGGAREGAGRKPNGPQPGIRHRTRPALASRHPAHVTLKLRRGLPRLRSRAEYRALLACFHKARSRNGCRLVHFAVLNDHVHLLLEAHDQTALSRGVQGLAIRIARALNKLWRRRGKVFADRYHGRALRTPREVKNALAYVLGNARKHAAEGREVHSPHPIDLFSSAPWFDGFPARVRVRVRGIEAIPPPTAPPRTWLLSTGWRRHGLLDTG